MSRTNKMANIFESTNFLASAFRTIFCLVFVVMCPKTASEPVVTSVTPVFKCLDSPLWLQSDQGAYCIDAKGNQVVCYKSETTTAGKLQWTDTLKFLVHVFDQKSFAIGSGRGVDLVPWDGSSNGTLKPVNYMSLPLSEMETIECGKGDAQGVLWIGTSFHGNDSQSAEMGRIYSMNNIGNATVKREVSGIIGGMAWNQDYNQFFYTNKKERTVLSCTFDVALGVISDDCQVVFDFNDNKTEGEPHGITVDTDGNLWVACLKFTTVLKIDPVARRVLTAVPFPHTTSITSVDFGGRNSDELYVTTANDGVQGDYAYAGTMFKVTNTSAKGVGNMEIKVDWPKPLGGGTYPNP